MATGGSGTGDVFDVRRVRRLVELMNEYELGEIDLKQGEQRIRLRRESEQIVTVGPAPAAPQMVAPAASVAADSSAVGEPSSGKFVTSPMVGTFYSSSSPDSPAFVKVGDQIGGDTVVCIIEAMKVFNEIPAECSGKIAAVLVENGDPVEFGQRLFEVT